MSECDVVLLKVGNNMCGSDVDLCGVGNSRWV
jgi:hypothetical protein